MSLETQIGNAMDAAVDRWIGLIAAYFEYVGEKTLTGQQAAKLTREIWDDYKKQKLGERKEGMGT